MSAGMVVAVALTATVAVFAFIHSAAPNTITITSGPQGSSFSRNAEKHKKILAQEGVTLNIVPSEGSTENLQRLSSAHPTVDAYTRRIGYLSKLVLPKGSLDFGKNIPNEDLQLIAPTVDHIETSVNHIVVPASFGDMFFGLRGHVDFVRNRLLAEQTPPATVPPTGMAA